MLYIVKNWTNYEKNIDSGAKGMFDTCMVPKQATIG